MIGDNKIELHFDPPVNAKFNTPFQLKINPSRIINIQQLKEKLARRLRYYPECIYLQYKYKPVSDNNTLQQLSVKSGDRFFIILCEPQYKKPEGVEPLIVGGLDLTDIKELNQFLVKKNYEFVPKEVPNRAGGPEGRQNVAVSVGSGNNVSVNGGSNSNRRNQQSSSEQIDFKVKYSNQLQILKDLGVEKDQSQLLALLISENGNVDRVINGLFG